MVKRELQFTPAEVLAPCIYSLWLGDKCIYVGKSTNFLRRIYFSMKGKQVDKVMVEIHDSYISAHNREIEMIDSLQPEFNINSGQKIRLPVYFTKVFARFLNI